MGKIPNFVGRHLLIDVQCLTSNKIGSRTLIYDFLEGLSRKIGMTLVYPPFVASFPFSINELERYYLELKEAYGSDNKIIVRMEQLIEHRRKDAAGVSGISVWLESHAAIHTWTEENFFSFDCYSCKEFKPSVVLKYICDIFDVESGYGLDIVRTFDKKQVIERVTI
jgi:S-adenosylmethionine decarboxylase